MTDNPDPAVTGGAGNPGSGIALFDERPFFEKALAYGVAHGLIGAERIEALRTEAPKGMVQIARYFGTEYLRPDLEKARERIVNLVSLFLQDSCEGDLHRAAQALLGTHDFTTFRSVQCQAQSAVKTLDRLDVRREGEHVLIETAARSFLHHQVRSMVGCLALVGMGRWSEERIAQVLTARDRQALGLNAPPEGLYFVAATY